MDQVLHHVAKTVEKQLDDELERLETLDSSDLEAIRQQRIAEMKQRAKLKQEWMANGHGEYTEIDGEKEFFGVCNKSSNVVCHFYKNDTPRCKIVDMHLKILAKKHIETRFVKLDVERAPFLTGRLKIRVIPTIGLVKDNKTKDFIVGFTDLGNRDDFTTDILEWRIARFFCQAIFPLGGPGEGEWGEHGGDVTGGRCGRRRHREDRHRTTRQDQDQLPDIIPYSWRAAIAFLMHSARTEGVVALWRGNSATMARIVPYAAIQFTAHEQWKRVLRVDTPATAQQHPILHLIAGSLAGVTSATATYPLDLARARMAVTNAEEYRTLRSMFVKVVKTEGFTTLYRGYPATVLGAIPYAGVSFFTYDTLKHKYLEHFGTPQNAFVNVLFGGAAGALAQTASYPLDIVRRRMQTARRTKSGHYQYASIKATIRIVYTSEGWRGFFKGLSMNWVKGPIAVGISFATYDAIKTTLRDLLPTLDR